MFPAPKPTARRSRLESGDTDVARLRMLDADSYTDWESAYRDNIDRLYRLMCAGVGNRPDSGNLTSEVFRTALGPLRLASSKGEERSYLLVTAQTVLASHRRRTLGVSVTSIDPESDLDALTERSGPADAGDAPQRAGNFAALTGGYRRILELRFLEACSINEAAHTLDISVSNAKVLQHRARRMAAKVGLELGQ